MLPLKILLIVYQTKRRFAIIFDKFIAKFPFKVYVTI